MTATYSTYNEVIREACGVDAAEAATIENVLRADPCYSTLDHLTRRDLVRAAREAREILEILREEDPEIAAWYAEGSSDVLAHDGIERPRGSRAGFQFPREEIR